jgi:tetratricopeptide (TPR) repeat protein
MPSCWMLLFKFTSSKKVRQARYQQMYQQHRADLLKWKRRIPSDYPRTVATTWELAFEQVEQRSPAAAELLRQCAFLDPDTIPEELFTQGASQLGPVLEPVVQDSFTFDEAIDVLRSFSLLRRLAESQSLSMHRLVQLVLKDRLDSPTQQQWAERTVRLVNAAFPEVEYETWEQCKRLLPQVFACLDLMNQHGIQTEEAASLLHRAGWYLNDHARNIEAEHLYQRSLAIDEKTLGPEHPDTSVTLYNLTVLYKGLERYQEAELLIQRSLAIDEKCFGSDHLEVALDLENYADLLQQMHRPEEAEQNNGTECALPACSERKS